MGDKTGDRTRYMREKQVRKYIDEIVYVSDDGLEESRSKAYIENYEAELARDRDIKKYIVGQLDRAAVSTLKELSLVDFIDCDYRVYKVANYKDFIYLVGQLGTKYHAIPNTYDIEKYKNVDFEGLFFIFGVDCIPDDDDELVFYDLNELKNGLENCISAARSAIEGIDDVTFVPAKAFVEPKIPNTVEPLTAAVIFPEFVDE